MSDKSADMTRVLNEFRPGDPQASDRLLSLVYEDLRKLAAARMAQEKPGQTLQATGLVHEAWLKISDRAATWENRYHFFAAAAEAMRRILIDRARRANRVRHGGELRRVDLSRLDPAQPVEESSLLELDTALQRLATESPEVAEVVRLRYFAGLTIEQTADVLKISIRTANRHWSYARAWLYKVLQEQR